uniref:SFRICE_013852 n=1 Tax=Spodoptera frugiperda TaxID=7108 RepID=A0A2H1WP23_SPOFR
MTTSVEIFVHTYIHNLTPVSHGGRQRQWNANCHGSYTLLSLLEIFVRVKLQRAIRPPQMRVQWGGCVIRSGLRVYRGSAHLENQEKEVSPKAGEAKKLAPTQNIPIHKVILSTPLIYLLFNGAVVGYRVWLYKQ